MTHSLHRKQKRNNECEEFSHCMASAKRIKLRNFKDISPFGFNSEVDILHINNNMPSFDLTNKIEVFQTSNVSNNLLQKDIAQCNSLQTEVNIHECAAIHQSNLKYLPDLSAAENPHYYENNKMLFELYVARIQRSIRSSVCTSHQLF